MVKKFLVVLVLMMNLPNVAVGRGLGVQEHVDILLEQESRSVVVKLLNMLLADEYVLFTKTFHFHWNVYGSDFKPLHSFFQDLYEELFVIIDEVAERVKALGGDACGSMQEFLAMTRLQEVVHEVPEAEEMVLLLLKDHEALIRSLRVDIETCAHVGDMGTNNFLTDLLEKHEKIAWMLRATTIR